MTEITKLTIGLLEKGINFTATRLYDGWKIDCGDWDAICHRYSYGGKKGLLEIMGDIVRNDVDDVEGWLTADDILARLQRAFCLAAFSQSGQFFIITHQQKIVKQNFKKNLIKLFFLKVLTFYLFML